MFNKIFKMLKKVYLYTIGFICIFPPFRKVYWNLRAKDIYLKWGNEKSDYPIYAKIISDYNIKSVLDFGCGSGRLIPFFNSMNLDKIILYDLSINAIDKAKGLYGGNPHLNFISGNISELILNENEIDLVISSKTLSAIHKRDIKDVLKHLCLGSKYFYLCELNTNVGRSAYWYKHNYESLMSELNFELIDYPKDKEWLLFKKNEN